MASIAEKKDASIGCPIAAADATGATGVYRYASSASNASSPLTDPTGAKHAFKTNMIRIQSRTVSTDIAFGMGAAPTLVKDQASAILTGHVSAGWTIPADGFIDVWVPAKATHVAWISSGTGGFVEFMLFETFAG